MGVLERFLPRYPGQAKSLLFVLTAVATGVTLLFAIADPSTHSGLSTSVIVASCGALLAVATAIRLPGRPLPWLWTAYPFTAILTITLLDLATQDASVTAQVFYFFPVLYAGAQLRRAAAVILCGTAVAADLVVTVSRLPWDTAVVQTCFVAAALSTTTALLVLAGERTDLLIGQLERQAAVDPLTGLLSRRVLDSAVSSALGGAASDGGTALLILDIDRFKLINDVHGHPAGDAVLQELAGILMRLSRPGDVVSRLGGDEVAVLLPGCPLDVARHRAEEIRRAVRGHIFDLSDSSLALAHDVSRIPTVTVSVGIAHLPTHAEGLRALYAAADASLYDAKRQGRDQVGASVEPCQEAVPS